MLFPALEEKLNQSKRSLERATDDNLIEHCQQYLTLLDEYRSDLYTLSDVPGLNLKPELSSSSRHEVDDTRKEIRAAIEATTRERNRITSLLRSFITVSGYEALEIFNRKNYKGRSDWTMNAGGIQTHGSADDEKMTIQEAVETASLLRREEYLTQQAAMLDASLTIRTTGHFLPEPLASTEGSAG